LSYFAELVLIPTPFFPLLWGKRIDTILQDLFAIILIFSALNMFVLQEVNGAGRWLGNKSARKLKNGFFITQKMGISISGKLLLLMKFNNAMENCTNYISNIANIPRI